MVEGNIAYLPGSQAQLTDKALQLMATSQQVFKQDPVADGTRALRPGETALLDSSKNRALRLAQEHNFLQMCRSVLWGDEDTFLLNEFGVLLRGAVESFRPRTTFELHLLRNVVEAQWRVWRISRMQRAIYEAESKRKTSGQFGLPRATLNAQMLDLKYKQALDFVDQAVRIYRKALLTANDAKGY